LLKGKGPYIILVLGIAIFTYAEMSKPKKLDWSPTFSKEDKIPYGAYVLFHLLEDIFPKDALFVKTESIYDDVDLDDKNDSILLANNSNYITITSGNGFGFSKGAVSMYMDQYETEVLLEHIAKGNIAFLASDLFPILLKDTLQFKTEYFDGFSFEDGQIDNIYCYNNLLQTKVSDQYFNKVIDSIKNDAAEIIASLNDKPVLVKFPFGAGSFYISTTPKIYSNYFLLKEDSLNINNYQIAEHTFNLLPNRITYWDEHYKFKVEDPLQQKSFLYYILSERSLKWALYTAFFSMLIFMLFKSKRLQSIIPVVKPETNLDVDFATTIGTLYYNEGNHADLAKKKILYWKEYVRNRYNISTKQMDDRFKKQLQLKSNIQQQTIDELVNTANLINNAQAIDTNFLTKFNTMLEDFYNID